MNKILKVLENKGYKVIVEEGRIWSIEYKGEQRIWVNGYGEEMKWNEGFSIWNDTYGNYMVGIKTGYNKATTEIKTTKQANVIEWIESNL